MLSKLVNELNTISNVSKITIIIGIILATVLMLMAIWQGGKSGLSAIYYSMSLANVATDIFAKVVIFSLIGECFLRGRA